MNARATSLLVLLAVLLPHGQAPGADGKRQGFVGSVSGGVGSIRITEGQESETLLAPVLEGTIGAGISDRLLLYLSLRMFFARSEGIRQDTNALTGAASYYLKATAPSFFLSGEVGLTGTDGPLASMESALGYGLGAGFEFAPGLAVRIEYMSATSSMRQDIYGHRPGETVSHVILTLGHTWY